MRSKWRVPRHPRRSLPGPWWPKFWRLHPSPGPRHYCHPPGSSSVDSWRICFGFVSVKHKHGMPPKLVISLDDPFWQGWFAVVTWKTGGSINVGSLNFKWMLYDGKWMIWGYPLSWKRSYDPLKNATTLRGIGFPIRGKSMACLG